MNQNQRKRLRAQANLLTATVQVGKNGVNENTISEIEKLLKKRKLIKVKLLQSLTEKEDRRELAKVLALKTKSELISNIGGVVVLYKESS